MRLTIHCCGCGVPVSARLTDGRELYPHRPDLSAVPFWRCDECGNWVGCHHRSRDRTRPLGTIPTPALRAARRRVHDAVDPLWRSGRYDRAVLYRLISAHLGREFHAAQLDSLADVETVIAYAKSLS
jgi:hypothetical protein